MAVHIVSNGGAAAPMLDARIRPPPALVPFLQPGTKSEASFPHWSDFSSIKYSEIEKALLNPSCAGPKILDITDECSVAFPIASGCLCFLVTVLLICVQTCRFRIKRSRQKVRLEKLGAAGSANCPAGHILDRYEAPGGVALCADCDEEIQHVWGCRQCKWGICAGCYSDRAVSSHWAAIELGEKEGTKVDTKVDTGEDDMPVPMALLSQASFPEPAHDQDSNQDSDEDEAPEEFEIAVSLDEWYEHEDEISAGIGMETWLRDQVKAKGEAKGMDKAKIDRMLCQVEIEDINGKKYKSLEKLEKKFHDDLFPVMFRYPLL